MSSAPKHSAYDAFSQYVRRQHLKEGKKQGGKGFAASLSSTLQDPEQNKIFQWLEVTSKHGIAQLSFPLIPEPILGSYQITVETKSGGKEYQSFRVEEYGKQRLIKYPVVAVRLGLSQIRATSAEFKTFEFSTSCLEEKDMERAGWTGA